MKIEAKRILTDAGVTIAYVNGLNVIELYNSIRHNDREQFFAAMSYAHECHKAGRPLAFCAEPVKPLVWVKHNDWCETAGDYCLYAIVSTIIEWRVMHQGIVISGWCRDKSAMYAAADAHNKHHREGKR